MGLVSRLEVLKHWLKNRCNVGFFELLGYITQKPFMQRGQACIESITDIPEYRQIKIRGIEQPLYYPSEMGTEFLYGILCELFYPDNWHYYEIPGMELKKEHVVVDCGAAEGVFSLKAAQICSAVYAIEPLPVFVNALHKTFEGMKHVHIIPCAASNETGTAHMNENGIESTIRESGNLEIKTDTIDSLFSNTQFHWLKIDVEGFEEQVLHGAKKSIRQYKPHIAAAAYHKKGDTEKLKHLILSLNPDYTITKRGIDPITGEAVMLYAYSKSEGF